MNIVLQLRRRSVDSIRRFTVPFIISLLLFADVAYLTCWPSDEKWPVYGAISLCIAAMFSVWWQLVLEVRRIRGAKAWLWQGASLIVWGSSYGAWMTVQDMTYIILYGSGIFLALTAGILAWLTYHAGESAFNRLFCGALQAVGVAVVADISLSVCAMALQTLLQLSLSFSTLYALIFYASFLVVGWNVFLSSVPEPGRPAAPSKPFGSVMAYVVVPVYGVLLVILYIYIAMICFKGEMPVGKMNWFASIALLVYAFCYLTCSNYDNHVWLLRYRRWGGLLLIPVVAVQLWGVYIRHEAYGLTELRYLSMACTAFGIAVIPAALRRLSGTWLFLLAAGMTLVISITPLNVLDAPYRSQERRLLAMMEEKGMLQNGVVSDAEDMSREDKEEIYSTYCYVKSYTGQRDPAVEVILQSPVMESLRYAGPYYRSRYFINDSTAVSVAGYAAMYTVERTAGKDGMLTVKTQAGDIAISLLPYAEQLCRQYEGAGQIANRNVANLYLVPDDGHYLYIRTMNVDLADDTIQSISISAILLEK